MSTLLCFIKDLEKKRKEMANFPGLLTRSVLSPTKNYQHHGKKRGRDRWQAVDRGGSYLNSTLSQRKIPVKSQLLGMSSVPHSNYQTAFNNLY